MKLIANAANSNQIGKVMFSDGDLVHLSTKVPKYTATLKSTPMLPETIYTTMRMYMASFSVRLRIARIGLCTRQSPKPTFARFPGRFEAKIAF
jgi:hypothetical protein